jgi:hypothetical protein
MTGNALIRLLFIPGTFISPVVVFPPYLRFQDDGRILGVPREMKELPRPLIHKEVDSHDLSLKEG